MITPPNPIDTLLPGRSETEEKALAFARSRISKAARAIERLTAPKYTPTTRIRLNRSHRVLAQLPALLDAEREARDGLLAKAAELAEDRRQNIPHDVTEVWTSHDEHVIGDVDRVRYHVTCRSPSEGHLSLGGCMFLGDALARERWFQEELDKRPAATPAPVSPAE